jgi:hypothetical protein
MKKIFILIMILSNFYRTAFAEVSDNDSTTKDIGLLKIAIGSIVSPYSTFKQLSTSGKSSKIGWEFTVGYSTLYTGTAVLLAVRDWEPVVEPTLPISRENYYWYQSAFTIPVGIAGVGINTLTAYGLSHAFGSDVTIGELWGPISVASIVPTFITMWIPETLIMPWREPGNTLPEKVDVARIALGSLWSVGLNIVAIKATTNLNWWKSSLIGVISASIMGTLMAVTYR